MNINQLEQSINQFHVVMMHINKEIDDMVKETGLGDVLSREQIEALRMIQANGSMTVGELATQQNIFKTAASKRINKLQDKGYVAQAPSDNKRIKLITLTDDGEKLISEVTSKIANALKSRLNNEFSEQELIDFVNQLDKLEQVLSRHH
ncbi:MarR family transcriptional regulator [Staphylococcus pasteuri]|uniref:MarR family winged helix-turn-helix transcriptional regulator n=1 Tax=Staphylococcus TaxID=1279 RepID=UPI00048B73D3|nr:MULTISPECIES: MarR family transcriptional regulator [Staphylococcus]MBL3398846.1 MarR family transcriptional regulator [Staphylococcus pasteuri]RNM19342.1 MarR family transcriptional regulator [Staphylococcus pasteuri]